ncbi:MAG: hypothetical protein H8E26_01385 [FCB group bacterium]|nr:hypothetical protein [FCB group bacterium]MBL7029234.1 hypothetical protein [Candidatus Neomarinimicrobiota bacterium]MBL7123217.1 hypothetical protein [Candidatus Neomarinimicrobiota bacterium]
MAEEITISRQELYNLVWSKPVVQIAKDFGISDVAVAKICKKLNIPKPGLGYWAKKQHGKRVRQTPLPELQHGQPDTYTIKGSMDANLNLTSLLIEKQKAYESTESNKITVKKTLRSPHQLVQQTLYRKKVRDSASYHEWINLPPGLTMSVSEDSYPRAMKIMDALLKALEKRGYAITATSGNDGYTSVSIDGEEIIFDIFESSRNVPNPEWKPGSYDRQFNLEPTGRLSLRTKNFYQGQKVISDGKVQRIEDKLNDFIILLVKVSEREKIRHQERIEWERDYQAKAQREQEIRLEKEREQQRVKELFDNATTWSKCVLARDYITAVESHSDDESDGEDLDSWVQWANQQVERIESRLHHPNFKGIF